MTKEIPLTRGKVALVDDEDYEHLNQFKWWVVIKRHTSYARRKFSTANGKRKGIQMHRFIMNPQDGMEIDHINGNGLDNRRENLRVVTRLENGQNIHIPKTSPFPGVSWHKITGMWTSQIQLNGNKKYLGVYTDELEAAKTYCVACVVYGDVYNGEESLRRGERQ